MTIPPDFTRRVQENPQIAVELLMACQGVIQWDARRGYLIPYRVRDPIHAAIASALNFKRVQAHYTELARQAAERNGEEVLGEHA